LSDWQTISLQNKPYLARIQIYRPENDGCKITCIESFCSPDAKKRYVEINLQHSEYNNFLNAITNDNELKDIVQSPTPPLIQEGNPFKFHVETHTSPDKIDRQERQLWKLLHIANSFTPIDDKVMEDISNTVKVNIPGTAQIPSILDLLQRETTGKLLSKHTHKKSFQNRLLSDRETRGSLSPQNNL